MIQPKLIINQPGDIYEQEADRVAEQVMRMPDPLSVSQAQVNSQPEGLSIQRITRYPEKKFNEKKTMRRRGNRPDEAGITFIRYWKSAGSTSLRA